MISIWNIYMANPELFAVAGALSLAIPALGLLIFILILIPHRERRSR